ncbi:MULTISPECIES: alpha/beta hydrolase [unclassified Actinomyces]|uniref:alpha/beta hydrolase n=1 Tax=unclassified Actinomyces TaxID=2609248 RepID=UPI002017E621|nr:MULTISPECIES: alpha/beta hydrolase [unclassified Actinomyces]MCL3777382.1 alpha/beta fold hydrolase [Actinomyces sp. AC-20-1]MCL3789096.1 alpha/beta fold hydrolase [Actinomyces sp. 187325]MCL3791670.1 alpha/beta fold hydrolase [Actinomyces sp. 186855]MCL3793898.1 alpha/beta fold hydrolase [Actinomyces sp. 217892]
MTRTPRHTRSQRALAALAATALALGAAACGGQTVPVRNATPAPGSTAAVPQGLESFYSQELDWYPCGDGSTIAEYAKGELLCATAEVPLDYEDPDGQRITLALKKREADGDAQGTLFVNPGGPGGSGVELVGSADGLIGEDVLKVYDVIGFDPRGVGSSTAVDCVSDAELDEQRSGRVYTAEELAAEESEEDTQAAVLASAKEDAAACEAHTEVKGLLDHIDTVSAARDLDILRALAGDPVLTYLGYSYGTYLGATYADLFPANVGRLVLDGAVDPMLSAGELSLGQAEGFENALRAFVKDCQSGSSCPLTGDVDSGVRQVQDFLDLVATSPIETYDPKRPLTRSLALDAIIGVLYADESWSVLAEALNQAMLQDDGSTMLYIADLLASRNDDGSYSGNGDEAITAINCLDYPVQGDPASWAAEADKAEELSPTFGDVMGYSDLYCQGWGHASDRERTAIRATGAAPILVVGTTGDPATPYQWSVSLSEQLDSAALLTWEGNGHTAYGRAGDCVGSAVDTYLLTGQLPEDGLTCAGQE